MSEGRAALRIVTTDLCAASDGQTPGEFGRSLLREKKSDLVVLKGSRDCAIVPYAQRLGYVAYEMGNVGLFLYTEAWCVLSSKLVHICAGRVNLVVFDLGCEGESVLLRICVTDMSTRILNEPRMDREVLEWAGVVPTVLCGSIISAPLSWSNSETGCGVAFCGGFSKTTASGRTIEHMMQAVSNRSHRHVLKPVIDPVEHGNLVSVDLLLH